MICVGLQVYVVYNSFTFPVRSNGKMMDSLRKTEENNMKKAISLVLCLLLLAGCAAPVAETTQAPAESVPEFTGQAPVETESTLRFGGDFYVVHKPERLAQLCHEACAAGLEPKRLRLVRHRPDAPVSLILLSCRKGGKPGLQLDELCLYHADGTPTSDYQRIYHL